MSAVRWGSRLMGRIEDRCRCGCGELLPCPYDDRYPIVMESARLMQHEGMTQDTAVATVLRRVARGQLKHCPSCRRPFISQRRHRSVCPDCTPMNATVVKRARSRRRTRSGQDALRKKRERLVAQQPKEPTRTVNAAIDVVLDRVGTAHQKRSIGRNHVGKCRESRRVRVAVVSFLDLHGEPTLVIRLLAAVKR